MNHPPQRFVSPEELVPSELSLSGADLAARDRELVDRCLEGEAGAWDELYRQFHGPLSTLVKALLGPVCGIELVDEIVARVWYKAVANRGAVLNRFQLERSCRLSTFLANVARSEVKEYFRSESRRRRREHAAARQHFENDSLHVALTGPQVEEFLTTLTPREREFFDECLIASSSHEQEQRFSNANSWQLRRRIYLKLRAHQEE